MNITIMRHEDKSQFIVTVENGFEITQITLYDMTVAEVAQFVKTIMEE